MPEIYLSLNMKAGNFLIMQNNSNALTACVFLHLIPYLCTSINWSSKRNGTNNISRTQADDHCWSVPKIKVFMGNNTVHAMRESGVTPRVSRFTSMAYERLRELNYTLVDTSAVTAARYVNTLHIWLSFRKAYRVWMYIYLGFCKADGIFISS